MYKPPPKKGDRIVVDGMLEEYAKAIVVDCIEIPNAFGDHVIIIEWPNAPGAAKDQLSRVFLHDEDKDKRWSRFLSQESDHQYN